MIQTMQSELFRIRKSRLFWACLVLAAFFVFALALTFYHNSVNGMLPVISLVSFTEFLFSDYSLIFPLTLFLCLYLQKIFIPAHTCITLLKVQAEYTYSLETDWPHGVAFYFFCLYALVLRICQF